MSVYVDNTRSTPERTKNWPYKFSCHLMADTDEELEGFALSLGLKRSWRQSDHYDLTKGKRQLALRLGAKAVTSADLVRLRQRKRAKG